MISTAPEAVKATLPNAANYPALTSIRFFAALYVFIFHLHGLGYFKLPPIISHIVSYGAVGVNLFFVLSGYILTISLLEREPKFQYSLKLHYQFLVRRIGKIYPIYALAIFVCLAASILLLETGIARYKYYSSMAALSLTMTQTWIQIYEFEWFNSGGWSISVEFAFYCLFPLLIPIMLRLSFRWLIWLSILCGLTSFSLAYLLDAIQIPHRFIYTFPLCRLFEFVMGIFGAIMLKNSHPQLKIRQLSVYCILMGIIGFFLYVLFNEPTLSNYIKVNIVLLPLILGFLLLVTISPPKWLENPTLEYLGKISYGFYIWQTVIIVMIGPKLLMGSKELAMAFVIFSTSIAAVLSYHFFELPAHNQIIKFSRRMI